MLSEYNKLGYPQGKPTHNKHLQGNYFVIPSIVKKLRPNHQRVRYFVILRGFSPEESLFDSPEILQVCHSERSEESLNESLVAKRDSSVVSLPLDMTTG